MDGVLERACDCSVLSSYRCLRFCGVSLRGAGGGLCGRGYAYVCAAGLWCGWGVADISARNTERNWYDEGVVGLGNSAKHVIMSIASYR
ncbi:hypothetical protein BDN67DRAFT_968340 [Paxillus ammoniavirescens]|nr:hypothetical protein BDN67DRAFT_968340 [Paxillus ammoniavirescens]